VSDQAVITHQALEDALGEAQWIEMKGANAEPLDVLRAFELRDLFQAVVAAEPPERQDQVAKWLAERIYRHRPAKPVRR
jgi:hypothetical protein